MKKIVFSALLAFAGFSFAQAQITTHPIDARKATCYSSNKDALGVIECEIVAFKEWNNELDRLYNLLMSKLDNDLKLVLKEEQLQWTKLRDVRFEFYTKFYEKQKGMSGLTLLASAKTDFVRARVFELQSFVDLLGK